MAARGAGVEGDERVWVVVAGRGEPGWRLSVEGEFGCELELGAAMVAAVRLGCASRELCVGKKNKGEGKKEWDALARQGRPGSLGSGRCARPDAAVAERPSERGVRDGAERSGVAGGGGNSDAGSTEHHGRAASRRACAASCGRLAHSGGVSGGAASTALLGA